MHLNNQFMKNGIELSLMIMPKNKIDISFINDDRFINGNQGWMRIDTLQSSETFE